MPSRRAAVRPPAPGPFRPPFALTVALCVSCAGESCRFSPGDSSDSEVPVDGFFSVPEVAWSETVINVPRLTWTTASAATCAVAYALNGGDTLATPTETEATAEHSALLLGLVPYSTYDTWLTCTADGDQKTSETWSLQTPPPESGLPEITLSSLDEARSAGGFTFSKIRNAKSHWAVVIDARGNYVWAYPYGAENITARVRPSRDGLAVLVHTFKVSQSNSGVMQRIAMDGTIEHSVEFPGSHTDVTEVVPGYSYAAPRWDVRIYTDAEGDRRHIMGGRLDEVFTDGTQREIWNVFEWFDPDLTREYANADYTGDDQAEDWVHLNSVHYDEVEDVFYVTSRFQNALFKIDHQTGDLLWTLGGAWSDFAMEQEQILIEPHSSQPIKDGFTFFEYLDHQSADCSAATDIAVDEGAMTVSQTWQYATETCTYNAYFGNSQALANGNRLLVLSHLAKIDEVVPATNDIVHRMTLPLNSTFGFAERFESLYP